MTAAERLLRYVQFDTQSNEFSDTCPSTDKQKVLALSLVEENVRRAAVQCYALEGAYPQDFDYLAERYGVAVDESRCRVDYIYIGSNLMPDITVVPLEGSA